MTVAKITAIGRSDLWAITRDRRSLPVVALGQIGQDWVPVVLDGALARHIAPPEMVALIAHPWMPTRAQIDAVVVGRHVTIVEMDAGVPDGGVIWEAAAPEKEQDGK